MLRTYSTKQTADFIFYLVDKEREEKLEYVWIHSMSDLSYEEWKKQVVKDTSKKNEPKRKKINKEKEKEALDLAEQILGKPMKGGGEMTDV